jgi:hypothetical protein
VKGTVAGEREPITGAGLELVHSGFKVLLQPTIAKLRATAAIKQLNGKALLRKRMGDTPQDGNSPGWR